MVTTKTVEHLKDLSIGSEMMVRKPRPTAWEEMGGNANVRVGDCVEVEHCYAQGFCSSGGIGFVKKVNAALHDGTEGDYLIEECASFDIEYILDARVEFCVPLTRITIIPMPYISSNRRILRSDTRESSVCVESPASSSGLVDEESLGSTNLEWLHLGLASRRHTKKGWLRSVLIEKDILKDDKEMLWKRVMEDYRCQISGIEGMRMAMGKDFKDPRETRGVQGANSGGKFISEKRPSQKDVPKNVWSLPYLLYAYDVPRTSFKRYRAHGSREQFLASRPPRPLQQRGTVIDSRSLAKELFNPSYFFAKAQIQNGVPAVDGNGQSLELPNFSAKKHHWVKYWNEAMGDSVAREGLDVERYEFMAREHDARQPHIKDQLVQALESEVTMSFYGLAQHLNWWCSPKSIERWLKRFPGYTMYSKNIKPGLSERNREKQVVFAKHVRNRWGLPPGTLILWIHCDEKWFHSLVPRRNAKAIAELGIEKESYSAHHKKHIAKVCTHA